MKEELADHSPTTPAMTRARFRMTGRESAIATAKAPASLGSTPAFTGFRSSSLTWKHPGTLACFGASLEAQPGVFEPTIRTVARGKPQKRRPLAKRPEASASHVLTLQNH